MEENFVMEQEFEEVEKTAKYVNPFLAWGLIAGEFVLAGVIALIVILPLV